MDLAQPPERLPKPGLLAISGLELAGNCTDSPNLAPDFGEGGPELAPSGRLPDGRSGNTGTSAVRCRLGRPGLSCHSRRGISTGSTFS